MENRVVGLVFFSIAANVRKDVDLMDVMNVTTTVVNETSNVANVTET